MVINVLGPAFQILSSYFASMHFASRRAPLLTLVAQPHPPSFFAISVMRGQLVAEQEGDQSSSKRSQGKFLAFPSFSFGFGICGCRTRAPLLALVRFLLSVPPYHLIPPPTACHRGSPVLRYRIPAREHTLKQNSVPSGPNFMRYNSVFRAREL